MSGLNAVPEPIVRFSPIGRALSVVGFLFGLLSAAVADERQLERSADNVVRQMVTALRELNYEGTFVHVAGTKVTSLRILHANIDGEEMERMSSLDGVPREVFRSGSLVTCIWPESGSVEVSRSKERRSLPRLDDLVDMSDQYLIHERGQGRVAGRAAHVLDIQPADELRYGHRLWVDVETHMLLRSKLLDQNQRPVEQIVFTSISFPETIDPTRFDVHALIDGQSPALTAELDAPASSETGSEDAPASDHIAFEALPAGYQKVSEHYREVGGGLGRVSHAMLTDGMASISVYVEHAPSPERAKDSMGHSTMGGLNAYGLALDDVFVTVVGEVPATTVRLIATATRFRR